MVHGCIVYSQRWQQSHVAPAMLQPNLGGLKKRLEAETPRFGSASALFSLKNVRGSQLMKTLKWLSSQPVLMQESF